MSVDTGLEGRRHGSNLDTVAKHAAGVAGPQTIGQVQPARGCFGRALEPLCARSVLRPKRGAGSQTVAPRVNSESAKVARGAMLVRSAPAARPRAAARLCEDGVR